MTNIQYRLSLPASTPLDEVVDRISTLQRAASLLPVQSISPLRILGSDDIKIAADKDDFGLGCIEILPRRVVGFTVQPGYESDRFDLFLSEYPESTGWTCDSICTTGARDSSLIDFLKSHLVVIALLDSAHDLGVEAEAGDDGDGDYWVSRSLGKLIAAFPGSDQPDWIVHSEFIESIRNLSELTGAVDLHLIPPEVPE